MAASPPATRRSFSPASADSVVRWSVLCGKAIERRCRKWQASIRAVRRLSQRVKTLAHKRRSRLEAADRRDATVPLMGGLFIVSYAVDLWPRQQSMGHFDDMPWNTSVRRMKTNGAAGCIWSIPFGLEPDGGRAKRHNSPDATPRQICFRVHHVA